MSNFRLIFLKNIKEIKDIIIKESVISTIEFKESIFGTYNIEFDTL